MDQYYIYILYSKGIKTTYQMRIFIREFPISFKFKPPKREKQIFIGGLPLKQGGVLLFKSSWSNIQPVTMQGNPLISLIGKEKTHIQYTQVKKTRYAETHLTYSNQSPYWTSPYRTNRSLALLLLMESLFLNQKIKAHPLLLFLLILHKRIDN